MELLLCQYTKTNNQDYFHGRGSASCTNSLKQYSYSSWECQLTCSQVVTPQGFFSILHIVLLISLMTSYTVFQFIRHAIKNSSGRNIGCRLLVLAVYADGSSYTLVVNTLDLPSNPPLLGKSKHQCSCTFLWCNFLFDVLLFFPFLLILSCSVSNCIHPFSVLSYLHILYKTPQAIPAFSGRL